MEIYPYGGFWAYLKYHYIDGMMLQTMLLSDKTRYNYDKDKEKIAVARKPKDKEATSKIVSKFGVGSKAEDELLKVRKEIGD